MRELARRERERESGEKKRKERTIIIKRRERLNETNARTTLEAAFLVTDTHSNKQDE